MWGYLNRSIRFLWPYMCFVSKMVKFLIILADIIEHSFSVFVLIGQIPTGVRKTVQFSAVSINDIAVQAQNLKCIKVFEHAILIR